MTKEDLALRLHGREYRKEITNEESHQALKAGLVVIFGASDDLMELRGAIYDEMDCYEGGTFYLTKKPLGIMENGDVDGALPQTDGIPNKIEAIWGEGDFSWQYKTEIPHTEFNIMEGDETYCVGMVIDTKDLS